MYVLLIDKQAAKQLQKLPVKDFERIKLGIFNLQRNPRPHGYLKLRGREAYRIRFGDYRVIYEINDEKLIVLIVDIDHRKNIYR